MSLGAEAWWFAMLGADQFEDGSLVIEDDTLDVNGGSTVNLRVKLGARPRSDVTVALSEASDLISLGDDELTFTRDNWDTYQSVVVTGVGNRQEIALQNGWWDTPSRRYYVASSRPQIAAALTPGGNRYFEQLTIANPDDSMLFTVADTSFGGAENNNDLSTTFEQNGEIAVTFGGVTYAFALAGADTTEPYFWMPSNGSDANTLRDALIAASDRAATFIIRDFESSSIAISLTASGPDEYSGVTGSASVTVN